MPGNDSNSYRAPVGHPRVQSTNETQTPQRTDEVTLPEITPAPDANVCGRTGCDETDGLGLFQRSNPPTEPCVSFVEKNSSLIIGSLSTRTVTGVKDV